MKHGRKVAILGGMRIPFCRSGTDYRNVGNFEMMAAALKGLVEKYHLKGKHIGDASFGAVLKHSSDWNMTRECVLEAGLSAETPGFNVQRACGTSLEAAIAIGNKIALEQIDSGIAGGVDTNSDVPLVLSKKLAQRLVQTQRARSFKEKVGIWSSFRPKEILPFIPGIVEPRTGLTMGQHCELMAQEWKIPRLLQDELAFSSHKTAAAAYARGFYRDLVVSAFGADKDNNVRSDTTLEKMKKLKPSFESSEKGTLTAANSTPLTDGAACVLLSSENWAQKENLSPEAYLADGETAAVDYVKKEGLLMAPAYAVSRLLARNNLKLQDFDYYEIHEAFAAQVLCTLAAWESSSYCKDRLGLPEALGAIDRSRLNVVGGSIALGHPFAATGARVIATAARLLKEKGKGRCLLSVCTAGGMGVAAIVER